MNREIKLAAEEKDSKSIELDACEPRSLIEVGWLSNITKESIACLENHLQVTIDTRAFIYDLNPE